MVLFVFKMDLQIFHIYWIIFSKLLNLLMFILKEVFMN